MAPGGELDYQSVRHCSKTCSTCNGGSCRLDYQSVRHCSKTVTTTTASVLSWITSQFDTAPKLQVHPARRFRVGLPVSSTLLQNGADVRLAVKLVGLPVSSTLLQNQGAGRYLRRALDYQSVRHCSKTQWNTTATNQGWITSQFDTAPKPLWCSTPDSAGWITSQFDTAPKPAQSGQQKHISWITSQFDTAPKRRGAGC